MRTVVYSHGWHQLPPFEWEGERRLHGAGWLAGKPAAFAIEQPTATAVAVQVFRAGRWTTTMEHEAAATVSRMLGFGIDVDRFYAAAGVDFAWAAALGAGPFLRSASVFEDAVKLLATTNCSWALTKQMVCQLVDRLGEPTPTGRKAFPTPVALAAKREAFFRTTIRAGYRAPYFVALVRRVAKGELDVEAWERRRGTTSELIKEIRQVLGFGPYVAECLCKLLGRFDGLGIDSWCVQRFNELHGPIDGNVHQAIADHYRRHGSWQGLALWLDLTRAWHEGGDLSDSKFPATPVDAT